MILGRMVAQPITQEVSREGLIHAPWGGPSGIIHGWRPVRLGYLPTCHYEGTGWPLPLPREELRETIQPISCKRCLKALGREELVVTTRTVVPIP